MILRFAYLFAFIFLLASCCYRYHIRIQPSDAQLFINQQPIETNGDNYLVFSSLQKQIFLEVHKEGFVSTYQKVSQSIPWQVKNIAVNLKKKKYPIGMKTVDPQESIVVDTHEAKKKFIQLNLEHGKHRIKIISKNQQPYEFSLFIDQTADYLFRYQSQELPISPLGIYHCGPEPKQVVFSPDDHYLFIPLLDGLGFDIFDCRSRKVRQTIKPTGYANETGFVEGIFVSDKNSFFVSQMTTGLVFEYDYKPQEKEVVRLKRVISTGGVWSKVIAWDNHQQLLAVSNWLSNDIVLIDYNTGKVVKSLSNIKVPRGIVFSHDGQYLYVAAFAEGQILKYETQDWKLVKSVNKKGAAMRHLVITKDDQYLFASNMTHNEIYQIHTDNFTIAKTYSVFYNPNTIELTPNEKYLFVSCRGPNHPKGYTKPSLINGKIYGIDLEEKKIAFTIEGGNQPTGLDISHDGKYLAFSNFKDQQIELYLITELYKEHLVERN
ncbi:MAG: hypothetical protein MJB14_23060 [Spirochaetes bacterium]|nr:hypothetical protein [Spirochaetota bacterium]